MRTILPAPAPHKVRAGAGRASETFGTNWPFNPFEITGLSLMTVKGRPVWKSRRKGFKYASIWNDFKGLLRWSVEAGFLIGVAFFVFWLLGKGG